MLYNVKLTSFNTDEIIMIDLCMKLLKFDASQAYECVDNMPSFLAEGVSMDKVKEIRAAFESEGAVLDVVPVSEEQARKAKIEKETLKKNKELASSNVNSSLKSSDLEIMNLKYNPYGNAKNNDEILKSKDNGLKSNKLEDRRNGVTYGRRSTDVNPMSTNYGRRSTDVNPMLYNDTSPYTSDLNTETTMSMYTDDLKENKSMSVYTNDLKEDKSMSVYTSDLKNDKSMSAYTSDLKNDKSMSVYTSDLKNNKSMSVYTSDLKNDKSVSAYTDGNKGYSPYTGSFDNKSSVYTGNLNDKIPAPFDDNLSNKSMSVYTSNMDDIKMQSNYGSSINNNLSNTNPFASPFSNSFTTEDSNKDEQDKEQDDFKFEEEETNTEVIPEPEKKIEPPNIPYANNMMNFTQQQDVGEISKDDGEENLFSLSGLRRNNGKGKMPYEKEQITCPKCGSAFVSTKRGQGLFGTSKVKYVCEACKNKF